jgi:hypothetical protein
MSFHVFENTNLDFKVSLIKLGRRQGSDRVYLQPGGSSAEDPPVATAGGALGDMEDFVEIIIPIDAAAILNLEINESSLAMGAKGTATISNQFNILERLNIAVNSTNDLYIAINIKDIDLENINIKNEYKSITVIGLINTTTAGSLNIVDNMLTFSWEEAFVAAMRKTQMEQFNTLILEDGMTNVWDLAEIFNTNIFKLREEGSTIVLLPIDDDAFPNVEHNINTTFGDKDNVSVYDAMHTMLNETTTHSRQEGVGKVPYFRFVNAIGDDGILKRKLKFDAFLTDKHIEFVRDVKDDVDKGDFSDVYTEKFSIGPLAETAVNDPNINIYNKIETYNITRADIGRLREEVWGDYQVSKSVDHGVLDKSIITFTELESDFIQRDLNGQDFGVNVPLLNPAETKAFKIDINTLSNPTLADNSLLQQENKIANIVIKSFLTINETINFTVKGSVIRQPNKFIWIERSVKEEDYKKLWYVNSVTHKFAEGKYTTDVIATKIFGDTTHSEIKANIGFVSNRSLIPTLDTDKSIESREGAPDDLKALDRNKEQINEDQKDSDRINYPNPAPRSPRKTIWEKLREFFDVDDNTSSQSGL